MPSISLHQIKHWQDPALPEVLDLYQTSFPPNEQMRLSWWIQLLNELSLQSGPEQPERLLYAALETGADDVVGFAYCEVYKAQLVGFLMYLATRADLRGQGVGAEVYQQVVEELCPRRGSEILLFEVEKPEVMAAESPQAEQLARRRIGWYQRQGARLLEGIRYVQSVGWQPPVEMALMFHNGAVLSPTEAFSRAETIFGSDVEQVNELHWGRVL
jgi:ribosomal protein S18 acetylase RimI-like enzyme